MFTLGIGESHFPIFRDFYQKRNNMRFVFPRFSLFCASLGFIGMWLMLLIIEYLNFFNLQGIELGKLADFPFNLADLFLLSGFLIGFIFTDKTPQSKG
ncbi:MAG: hypothetical protein AAGD28_14725 [Bacteroidota bacterium]